jgi:hypothetical protein
MKEIDNLLKDIERITAGFIIFVAGIMAIVIIALIVAGCGHNTGSFTIGTRVNAGNATANISYTDGLNVVEVSRENSSWDIQVDANNGVSVDSKTGAIKGVKRLKREIGPQITGSLVELAKKDPEMARLYIEAVRNYWQYRSKAGEKE